MAKSLCFKLDEAAFTIKLYQYGKDNFEVIYGLQVDSGLTYGRAAAKLGAAIMHSLACEQKLDNREKGER